MGNNSSCKTQSSVLQNPESLTSQRSQYLDQIPSNLINSLSGRSFASLSSHQSTYSVSRPWSRVSRRRWKESTLTLPYESSKTAWPVSQLESFFLPDFPIGGPFSEKNFDVIQEVSAGAFGKVYKVEDKETRNVYALKVLAKSKIVKENSVQQVKDEVKIQRVCGHHPFIVNCPFHWQSRKRLYIVTDFIEGGELFQLLKTYLILPKVLVQLYVAQIALAIDFLHNAGIIYRDLKPENILLDKRGNVQLIDFGLSKWLSYGSKTKTLCGTLRYMAPEIATLQPYGHAVDWWSLGVIACLMLTGQYPGYALSYGMGVGYDNPDEQKNSKFGALPSDCSLDVPSKDLLLRLLEIEPTKRLRSLRTLQIIAFYKDYNFDEVRRKKINAKELLNQAYPNGPPEDNNSAVEDFDINMDLN